MTDSHSSWRWLALLALLALWQSPSAFAHSGHAGAAGVGSGNTLDNTIRQTGPGYGELARGSGERYRVLRRLGSPSARRASTRRSIAFFAQLTDPQLVDEMSPARVEFLDPVGGEVSAAHRPQEAFGPFVWDRAVRAANRNRVSRVRQGTGARSRLGFALLTGDLLDNQQLNEARWYIDVLEGRPVDPFSGKRVSPENPCPQATPQQEQRLNDDVANRRYTGVQDYSDYPGLPQARYHDFWDPDRPPESGPYAGFPHYPGLMNRAQSSFQPEGLRVPWYTARGNHDGLVQGNAPANPLYAAIAVGCLKVFPSNGLDPASLAGQDFEEIFAQFTDPAFLNRLLAGGSLTPPDGDRRFLGRQEFKSVHGPEDRNHGFGHVDRRELEASAGAASYYAFNRSGLRMVSIDTVAEGGQSTGNLDDPQYRWLERELDRNSAVEVRANGRVVRDGDPNRLIVVYGHHTLDSMNNSTPDEAAPPCGSARQPGCDEDPRSSTPLHRGTEGSRTVRDLLLRYPNVISYVSGHTHENAIDAFKHPRAGTGFWQLNTASLVDAPQQLRTIEVMDNRDGTLSLFNTVIDHAAPISPPPSGSTGLSDTNLASISRALSFADPQADVGEATGGRNDRNVEALLRDPRLLASQRARTPRGQRGRRRGGRRGAPTLTGKPIAR